MAEYIVEKNKKGFLWGILTGLATGAALGILFAPDKGEETRKKIKDKSAKLKTDTEEALKELGETVGPWIEEVQDKVEQKIEPILEEVEEKVEPVQAKAQKVLKETKRRFFKNIRR